MTSDAHRQRDDDSPRVLTLHSPIQWDDRGGDDDHPDDDEEGD